MEIDMAETQIMSKKICVYAGITLITFGIIFSIWVFSLINGFFRSPDHVTLIGKMLRLTTEEQTIHGKIFDNDFSITYSNFLGYFVLLIISGILLTSAGRIVAACLSGGIEALSIAAGVSRSRNAPRS
jgi:hypothetical protein